MKSITLSCCLCLPFLGQAQTAEVQIAGSAYPVMFKDTTLSVTNRQRIATDLSILFSVAPSFEELKGEEEEAGIFRPNTFMSLFALSERSEGISLVDQNNQKSIQVNKVASSNYLHAFAFVEVHSNAVQKANKFVMLMNSTNLLSQPIQVLRNLRHAEMLSEEGDISDNEAIEFATERQKYKYSGISVLNFFLQRVPQVDNAEVLVTGLFMIEKANPSLERAYGLPIDFYNGRWGFGRMPWDIRRNEIVE